MAYNTITDTRIAVGKPGDNNLFTDLRDNPIGIANGDTGAPPVQSKALAISIQAQGSTTLLGGSGVVWTPPAGIYNFYPTGQPIIFEFQVSAAWRGGVITPSLPYTFVCDGTNARWRNNLATSFDATIFYQRLSN